MAGSWIVAGNVLGRLDDPEGGVGDLVEGQDLLGPRLVEADPERQGIGAGIRDVQHLADRRNVRLPVRPEDPFGDVEDEVGLQPFEAGVGFVVGFDKEDLIPLLEDLRMAEIVSSESHSASRSSGGSSSSSLFSLLRASIERGFHSGF